MQLLLTSSTIKGAVPGCLALQWLTNNVLCISDFSKKPHCFPFTVLCIAEISKKSPEKSGIRYSMGIFATGVVYGCNPDALFCVIPAITLPTKLAAATYTAMFVLGTVGAMGGYTAFIG